MINSWLSLLPPLIVIVIAAITHRIHAALATGIIAAALVSTQGSPLQSLILIKQSLLAVAFNIDNILLYAFLTAIGVLVAIFTTSGSASSFCHALITRIKNGRQAQYASMFVSMLLCIDDYLSILTTGHVMQSVTDEFKVSRYQLAFLVHSLAGPVVILAPISSWVAAITAYISSAGVENELTPATRIIAEPFFIYLQTIPFIFYSFFIIFSAWYIIHYYVSFGPMKKHENDIPTITVHTTAPSCGNSSDLIAPLATLIIGIIIGFPLAGGYFFGGACNFIDALKRNDQPFLVMLIAALLAISMSFLISLYRKTITVSCLPKVVWEGFNLMRSAIGMVFLASALSGLLAAHVGTGDYLASLLIGSVPLALIPAMFFIVSLIATLATGSAWGNCALMVPIAVPMLCSFSALPLPLDPSAIPLLFPVLGAIFSGAVCGNHISPLSETTLMTASSTGTIPFTHAYTQIFYALPAIVGCLLGYIVTGYMIPFGLTIAALAGLACGITVCIISFLLCNR